MSSGLQNDSEMTKEFFYKLLQPMAPMKVYLFWLGVAGVIPAILAYYGLLWVTFATVIYATVILAGIWLGVSWTLVRGKTYRVPIPGVPDVSAVNVLLQTLMEGRSQGISSQHSVVISPNIDTSLQDVIDLIVRDFILTWYRQLGQDENNLVGLLQHEVWQLIEEVRRRLANIDYVRFISSEVVSALHTHFRDIRHANTKRKDGDQQPKFLLHPWLENSATEVDYLRKVSDTLLVVLLPERYSMCTSVRHLLREILAVLVLQPSIDHITNPDYINQTLLEYLEYREKLAEDTQRTYTYAASYEDFVKLIDDCSDIEHLKQIRYKIITEIMHATTISNLKKAQGINTDKASAPESMTKGELLKARNLKRYINQLTVAKTRSEKRIHLLGGPDYQSYTEMPDSDSERKVIPGQKVLSFSVIMESPPAREYLMRYLRREDSDSLLGYWVAVEKLRQSEREQRHTIASDIYQHYVISPTSALHLEKATMKSMETFLLGNGGPDEFYEVQSQIYKQIEEKHYPSFIVSDVYHQYISSGDDDTDEASPVPKDEFSSEGKSIYSDADIADGTAAIASQSFHAQQLLEQLSEKISNKLHAVQAMKASKKADEKMLKVQSEMDDELEKLKLERRQLEFHIERTDIWCENVGIWRATIYSAEAVSEGDKVVPNYVILIHLPGGGLVSPAVQGSTQGWVISRSLRDFQALHQKLMQIGSWLKKKELPSMHWFRSVDSSFLENSKSTLQDYLDTVLKDDRLVHSEVLYAFLMPTPEYLKQQPLPEKQRGKFFFTNLFKGSPSSSQSDAEAGDLLFAGDDSSKEGQNKDSIAEPLYVFIREVFELRGVFKWLRKSFIVFVEVTFGRSINRQIRDTVSWVFSEPMIVYYINIFRESMWPDGKLADPSPVRSDREKMATRLKAKHKCLKSMPDAVKSLVGEENCRHGAIKTFEVLQDSRLNKQILYVLLHLLLLEVCPEFAQFLAKEANAVTLD